MAVQGHVNPEPPGLDDDGTDVLPAAFTHTPPSARTCVLHSPSCLISYSPGQLKRGGTSVLLGCKTLSTPNHSTWRPRLWFSHGSGWSLRFFKDLFPWRTATSPNQIWQVFCQHCGHKPNISFSFSSCFAHCSTTEVKVGSGEFLPYTFATTFNHRASMVQVSDFHILFSLSHLGDATICFLKMSLSASFSSVSVFPMNGMRPHH